MNIDEIMRLGPVIPVIVVDAVERAVPLARALVEGGIRVLEVTLRTPVALEAIRAIRAEVPNAVLGAGTVITAHDLERAMAAGASFAVSPGTTGTLLAEVARAGFPWLPGVSTASNVMDVLDAGFDRMKFFPAEAAGGIPMLKALAGPFPAVQFCPTGGIGPANARDYLALANVHCVGGSWLSPNAAMNEGAWGKITELARAAVALRRLDQ